MKSLSLILTVFASFSLYAQWNTNGTHIYNSNLGYVGIGTTNPLSNSTIQSSVGSASTAYPLSIVSLAPDAASGSGVGMSFYLGGNSTESQRAEHARITVKQTYYGVRPSFTISTTEYNSPYTAFVDRLTIDPFGSVGIGTNTPLSGIFNKGLHIGHGDHSTLLLGNPTTGNHGGIIQTSDARHRIFIGANLYDDPVLSWKNFQQGKGGAGISILADEGTWGTSIDFYTSKNNDELLNRLHINGDGNVGISTTDTHGYKLAVAGTAIAEEVIVELEELWPDYVFEKDHKLPSLAEVETYIKQNKHLAEIPSAEEVKQNGLKIGEMNALLLKKVEEITLYLIELKKENEEQRKQIQELQNKVNK